jgi:hypothetical protein
MVDKKYTIEKVRKEEPSKYKLIEVVVIVLLFLFFEYIMVSPLIRARIDASKLNKFGIIAEARVVNPDYQIDLSYFVVDVHNLSYQFIADDPERGQAKTYTDSQFVSRNAWQHLNPGDNVTIIYLTSDPTISRLAGTDADNSDLSDSPLITMLFLIPIFIGWVGWMWKKGKFRK